MSARADRPSSHMRAVSVAAGPSVDGSAAAGGSGEAGGSGAAGEPFAVAAIDLGATSGRVMLGVVAEGRIELVPARRFENRLVERDGHLSWDLDALWTESGERPDARTVDVHVRRLRRRLGSYASIVRTIRGAGYRFDEHPDVAIWQARASR